MLSDEWLPRYRPLENFNIKWNGNGNGNAHGNGNAYDRGDYNSSFALRAVELKIIKVFAFRNQISLDLAFVQHLHAILMILSTCSSTLALSFAYRKCSVFICPFLPYKQIGNVFITVLYGL